MGEEAPLADSVVAVEVAAALAPEPQQPAVATAAAVKEPVRESHEGVKLHLSSRSPTGYRGVRKERLRYRAEVWSRGKHRNLGTFGSAVDAAVAYARAAAEKPAADEASVTVAATLAVDGVAVDATIAVVVVAVVVAVAVCVVTILRRFSPWSRMMDPAKS